MAPARRRAAGGRARRDERRELRIETASRIGVALTVVGDRAAPAGVVTRAFASDPWRVPWGNMYEFTLTGALGVAADLPALLRALRLRWMGLFLTGFQVVVLMLANLTLEQEAGPLVPALHSYWLVIHVGAAILATGAFAVGALTSVVFLVKERVRGSGRRGSGAAGVFPDADALDRLSYRLHAVGFPLWTFAALIAGPIWAEYAWGSYWNWDPKEVWAFITWVVYAAYLHARATAGWKGQGRRDHRADRLRDPAVQLRRHQLLLRRRQHALLRLTGPGWPGSARGWLGCSRSGLVLCDACGRASAGSPRRRRGRPGAAAGDGARPRRGCRRPGPAGAPLARAPTSAA